MSIPRLEMEGGRLVARRGPSPKPKRAGRKPDAERAESEPWRRDGYGAAYRAQRQLCIERARGRCQACGKLVAAKRRDGTWTVRGGETHHERPLRAGGAGGRLALLCTSCHRRADAALRRGEGSES